MERALVEWQFDWNAGQVIDLSFSAPYDTNQSPASMYQALGWRVLSEQKRTFSPAAKNQQPTADNPPASEDWLELKLSNELGGYAYALVAFMPLQDMPLQDMLVKSESVQDLPASQASPVTARCILLCESGEELSTQQLSELYAEFYSLTRQLREAPLAEFRKVLGIAP